MLATEVLTAVGLVDYSIQATPAAWLDRQV
jgi:hypothetical protein